MDILVCFLHARYFFQIGDSLPAATQTGVFRTNCIDCLDRTNVVQNTLSTEALLLQLKGLGAVNVLSSDLSSLPVLSRWWQEGLLISPFTSSVLVGDS